MIHNDHYSPNTKMIPVKYQFLSPATLHIKNKDGDIMPYTYGIGDIIEVLKPQLRYLIHTKDYSSEIPMANGHIIVKYPYNINVVQL